MSSIFGDVEPPKWLQDLTAILHGEFGKSIGMAMGAGLIALQPNEQGDGLKGIGQGLKEARLNEQDPNWKVKTKALEAQVVNNWANAATTWQTYDNKNQDLALWTTEDLPALTKFQQDLKDDPNAIPPVMKSTRGQGAVQSIERMLLSKQSADIRQQNGKIAVENAKRSVDFDQAVSAAPPEIGSQIDELPNQGWNVDRRGKRTSPSTAALRYYNDWAQSVGKDPFGTPATVQAARARGEEQRKTEAAKAKNPRETAAVKNIETMNAWEQSAKEAEAAGDKDTAATLRKNITMLQEQMKGWGMSVGFDDKGNLQVNMGKGAQPTVGTQTMAQGKMLQYENAAQQIDYLQKNLTAAHVGVAGKAGELLIDKSMEQLFPGSENKGRVQVRSTLTYLRDGLMREMADDRSGRFSAADREEVGKALPSSGVFESEADAKDRLERVRQILAGRTKVYARSMSVPAPAWSLDEKDKDEIVRRYKEGIESKLDPNSAEFKKKGFLSKDEAAAALQRSE